MNIRYFTRGPKNKIEVGIERAPYTFDVKKCASYLDLFLPELTHNNEAILKRCQLVLNTVFKYAGKGHRKNILLKEVNCWSYSEREPMFSRLFVFDLDILCSHPCGRNAYHYEYSFKDILLNKKCYESFCNYWLKQYNYDDLFHTLYTVSCVLSPKEPLPNELIDMILCQAFYLHNIRMF
jgi:hypothetical protein